MEEREKTWSARGSTTRYLAALSHTIPSPFFYSLTQHPHTARVPTRIKSANWQQTAYSRKHGRGDITKLRIFSASAGVQTFENTARKIRSAKRTRRKEEKRRGVTAKNTERKTQTGWRKASMHGEVYYPWQRQSPREHRRGSRSCKGGDVEAHNGLWEEMGW